MATVAILAASILLQLASAVLALRLNHRYGRRWAWTLMSAAIVLMAIRRCVTFYDVLAADLSQPRPLVAESVALAISGLMLVAVAAIDPIFRAVASRAAEQEGEKRQLSGQVEMRTAEREAETFERRRAESALRDAEALYRTLVDTLPLCLVRKDLDGHFTFANARFRELAGLPASEIVGRTDFDLYAPELAEKYREDDRRVLREGRLFEDVERHDGDPARWVQVLKSPVCDSEGRTVGVQAMFWDVTERHLAQEQLALSGERKRAIFDACPDGMLLTNPQGEIVEFNAAAESIYGRRRDEVLGRPLGEVLFPPDVRPTEPDGMERFDVLLGTAALHGRRFETTTVRADGGRFVAELVLRPIPQGTSPVLAVFVRDVTERRTTEQDLARERHLLHVLMDNLPESIYFKDAQSRFVRINRALAARFGLHDPTEALGRTDFDFFTEAHARQARADELRLMETGEPILDYEEVETWPDGRTTWVATSKLPLRDASGHVTGTFGISRDVTERRRAARRLEESEHRLRMIVESSYDPFVAMDGRGRITDWNPQAEAAFGWSRKEVMGRELAAVLLPERFRDEHRAGLRRFLETGVGPLLNRRIETIGTHRDGREFPVELTISPVRLDADWLFCAFVHDISERKEVEQSLRAAKEAAEAANRAKSEFLANMSHEIRTPMNAVLGMTELVLDTPLEPAQREYLSMVQDSAESLLSIINDVLDFSKIEAGRLDLVPAPFGIRGLLADTMQWLTVRARRSNLALSCRTAPDVPGELVGDAGRLRQVIVNLVGNAIKFTERGEVAVDVSLADRNTDGVVLRFSVRDTGIGIPRDRLDDIFEAFVQADTSSTRRYQGTGLGLTISARLVRLMGGTIEVDTEPGRGSTFRFTADFGLAAPSPAPSRAPAATGSGADRATTSTADAASETEDVVATAANDVSDASIAAEPLHGPHGATFAANGTRAPEPTGPLHVLLVEDSLTNQKLALGLLGKWGHDVTVANDGREALDAWEERPFDVILMDVQMPVLDGLDATRAIRAREAEAGGGAHVPIVAMTAHALSGDREACLRAGMDAYVSKPIRARELLAVLESTAARVGAEAAHAPASSNGTGALHDGDA